MEDKFLFQHYLVVFFDNLGQREHLRKITGIPTNEVDKEKFIDITKKSFGRVLNIRDAFGNYFKSANAHTPNVNLVSPEDHDDFIASSKFDVSYYGISDAVLIAVPLMSNDENCTAVNGIYYSFIATCGIGLLSLSCLIPRS